jgi:hypothetical protein
LEGGTNPNGNSEENFVLLPPCVTFDNVRQSIKTMSEESINNHDAVVRIISDRLKERKCRGIKANIKEGGYEKPEKIVGDKDSGAGFVPDVTVAIPSYVIAVEDASSIDSDESGAAWMVFAAFARKTFREFIIAAPRSSAEKLTKKIKSLKIRNARYIWY